MRTPLRLALIAIALTAATSAADDNAGLRFEIALTEALGDEPVDGRLLVMLSTDPSDEPRFQISDRHETQQVFGVDVEGALGDTDRLIGVHRAALVVPVELDQVRDDREITGRALACVPGQFEGVESIPGADIAFERGHFRVRGDIVEVRLAYEETALRVEMFDDEVEQMRQLLIAEMEAGALGLGTGLAPANKLRRQASQILETGGPSTQF